MATLKRMIYVSSVRALLKVARQSHHAALKAKRLKWYGAEDDMRAKRDEALAECRTLFTNFHGDKSHA